VLQNRFLIQRTSALAFLAIALVLWLNFAFIDHQYDLSSAHHKEHHCQLFASGLHGAASASLVITPLAVREYFAPLATYHYTEALSFAYLPRSPPLS
jgi:hypothetical protein